MSTNPRDLYKVMQRTEPLLPINQQTFRHPHDPRSLKIRLAAPICSWMAPGGQGNGWDKKLPPKEWFPRTDPNLYPKYMKASFSEANMPHLMKEDQERFKQEFESSRSDAFKHRLNNTTPEFYPRRNIPEFPRKILPLGDPIRSAPTREATGIPIPDPYACPIVAGARIPRGVGTIYNGRPRLI